MIIKQKDHADGIVLYGMSCSGKTTFANNLKSRQYYCFDALFKWHDIETLGLSISESIRTITEAVETCPGRWVLDGWHLADARCQLVPSDACVYVIYADYETIVDQYRIAVMDRQEYLGMYKKWYNPVNLAGLYCLRYFYNDGSDFTETDEAEFQRVTSEIRSITHAPKGAGLAI